MRHLLIRSVVALGLIAGGLATGSRLAGQGPPRQDLPRAEDLLDREAEAVGGKAAFQKVKTVVLKAKVTVGDMQLGFVAYHAGPKKHRVEVTCAGLRKKDVVVCGEAAWEEDSITGCRFLKGGERAQAVRQAEQFARTFRDPGNWRQQYKQVRTVAEEQVEGKPAYKVHLTTRTGEVVLNHYDKHSGLLVRQETTVNSPQGKLTVIEFPSDYRKVDGIVRPFASRVVEGPTEVRVTVEQIAHNVDMPEQRFTLPAGLKRLQVRR